MAEVYKSSRSINTSSGGGQKNSYSASRNGQRPSNSNQMNSSQKSTPNKKALSPQQENAIKKQQENDPNNPNNQDLNMQQKLKKKAAKETLTTAAKAYNPAVGKVVEKALETKKGDEYLNEFAKADSTSEGVKKVVKKANDERKKKQRMLFLISIVGPTFFILFIFLLLFTKNADSQTYSNDNDGQVIVQDFEDEIQNVFLKYPGLYEKVQKEYKEVADEFEVNVDRFLIAATLVAPLENDFITPVKGNCGSPTEECYYFKGKLYNWEDFISLWAEQTELLAKMQILSYIDKYSSNIKVECGSDETMEQFAKNDLSQGATSFWSFLDIFNLFGSYRDEVEAELNARCTEAPPGESVVPDVRVLSIAQGIYYNFINAQGEHEYVKEPDTGGVYFWNLVNKGGFIDTYFHDYLAHDEGKSEDELYEINLPKILEIANYIYSYYESIRRDDCKNNDVIESKIEKIKVLHKDGGGYDEVDLEQYVGGVLMAEMSFGGLEAEKAMAILARTEGIAIVGTDGEGVIENSSNAQNYNGAAYNPTYDPKYENQEDNPNYDPDWPKVHLPKIYQAVQETKGMVILYYDTGKVRHTEYDAFCPQNRELIDGFWYLDDGQRDLPINPAAYRPKYSGGFSVPEKYLNCPCFKNPDSRPPNEELGGKKVRFSTSPASPPTEVAGTPPQETLPICWTDTGMTRQKKLDDGSTRTEYAWTYKPSGGHGRGASQYGLKYFEGFDYKWDGLLGLFFTNIKYGRLDSSKEIYECTNSLVYDGQCQNGC